MADTVPFGDLVEAIGAGLALALSKKRGGRSLSVPAPGRLGPASPVVVLVGPDAAESLARRWGGSTIMVPSGPGKRALAWEWREAGWTVARIAETLRCTERTVYNILAGPRPAAAPRAAAPAEEPPLLAFIARRGAPT
ncbi:MAG: hypothetical protein RLZZ501_350 [Pseudomonadota bacterium]|jgi:hypothetical protein